MAKTIKPTPRKPVKAKGSLPAPRVAPVRDITAWYARPKNRAYMALAALLLIAFVAKSVLDARSRAEVRAREAQDVEQFERRVTDLNLGIQPIYAELGEAPGAFLAGALAEDEYRTQAQSWIETFRELSTNIRAAEAPQELVTLQEAKALYIQATTIYIDAAKMFLAAAGVPDPAERETVTVLARNTFLHGASVYSMGDREITRIRNEYDLNDPHAELPAPALPEEEYPLPEPGEVPAEVPAGDGTASGDGTAGVTGGSETPVEPAGPQP